MQQRVGHLGKGVVHLIAHSRLIVASQAPMANMADYAHYQSRAGTHGGDPDALANCVFPAESMLGEIVVNHDHRFATDAIMFIEEAALAERNADRKSTRLNSSHLGISYAVFCLKKKKTDKS